MNVVRKTVHVRYLLRYIFFLLLCMTSISIEASILTRWSKVDPYPLYSSTDPYEFLQVCKKNDIKDNSEECIYASTRLAFSTFYQTATGGTALTWGNINADPDDPANAAELGNLTGPWNIIGLFYDTDKQGVLIEGLGLDDAPSYTICNAAGEKRINFLLDPAGTDTQKRFGFFSVPISYKKYGVRFEGEFCLSDDIKLNVFAGVSHIIQEPVFIDLTCSATGLQCPIRDCTPPVTETTSEFCTSSTCCTAPNSIITQTACQNDNCCVDWPGCACKQLTIDRIMKERDKVAELLGMNLHKFEKTSFEDLELDLTWSHMYVFNKDRCAWPFYIFTPFCSVGATFPTGSRAYDADDPLTLRNLFSLPFGNDGHYSYGGRIGGTIDFVETVSIGAETGFTAFSWANHKKYPVPTNEFQSGIFPELATVRLKPGLNWHFTAYLGAYHFLDRLSFYANFVYIGHDRDDFKCLSVEDPNNPVLFDKLRAESAFRVMFVNTALNYDIAECMQLGFVWQIPVSLHNAYRSTTILATLQFLF